MELLRPTAPAEAPAAPPDDVEAEEPAEQGGESPAAPARPNAKRKRTAPAGKTRARNLRLTDDVHDRLFLLARQRRQTVSAVANDLLDRALPRWELKRQG